MHQYVSRALARGSSCLLKPSFCGIALTTPPNFQTCKLAPAQSSRSLTTATSKGTRSYTPISRGPTPPPTKSPEEFTGSPYIVRRTPSAQLPVYRRFTSGGNREVVFIKKVDGDRKKLLEDLVESLGVSRGDIRLNPLTQHLELKGNFYDRTKSWLLERGF
ncbi:ribosomal protein L49/IMG2 [Pochonia chlamydosporia 170]|uniref:Large ribosomal subunit protein mL49 n=1 Tax=Pochonia chlamydosporia 170 TaxID=1380566 RepID=A0A179FLB9_METCM|nr:ribosomal protein L49/IMG2 [Pochonia chlamydosporia 170]OAQ66435.1 ribosomal protein L49/IMG2 [Pochonia chlamydosporia 170]